MPVNIADYLSGIIESIGIPLFVFDLDGTFQFINESFSDIFGKTCGEVIGRKSHDIFPEAEAKKIKKAVCAVFATGQRCVVEIDMEVGQKKTTFYRIIISPIENMRGSVVFVSCVAVEDTEHRQVLEALRESEKRFMDVVYASGDAILLICDNEFVDCNEAAVRMLRYTTKGEFLRTHPSELSPLVQSDGRPSHEKADQLMKCAFEKGFKRFEWTHLRANGEEFPVEVSLTPIVRDGKRMLYWVWRDITESKKAEERSACLQRQLVQAQKMEAIGTLASGIAHDFNNMLYPISGHAEMLLDDLMLGDSNREGVEVIYKSALRATELIKQILAFSRQEKSELKMMRLQPIIKESMKLIRATIPTTISITQQIDSDCGTINADPTQIHQIIMNLATNAFHAMEEQQEGELNVGLKEIELDTDDLNYPNMLPGPYVCLTVADNGMGMAKDIVDRIFDPFFTTKEKGKGTGMGLSVVHGIVKSMNGEIQVYSELVGGTEFRVYLPIVEDVSGEKGLDLKEDLPCGGERILLVDDEEAIINMGKQMLRRLGYSVSTRSSGIEALEAFRADPDRFDLVVTDMAMPKMAGTRLAIELIKIRPNIPVLLCTGFSEGITDDMIESLGIKGLLNKPILKKDLARKIREVLDGK